jgi:hypothetical protein
MKKQPKKAVTAPSLAPKSASKRKKYARTGKILTATLYCYVEPKNADHARKQGKDAKYGTFSGYVNALIAKDRGVKPTAGTRGQEKKSEITMGELKKKASSKSTKKPSKPSAKLLKKALKNRSASSTKKAATRFKVGKTKTIGSRKVIATATVTGVDTNTGTVTLETSPVGENQAVM